MVELSEVQALTLKVHYLGACRLLTRFLTFFLAFLAVSLTYSDHDTTAFIVKRFLYEDQYPEDAQACVVVWNGFEMVDVKTEHVLVRGEATIASGSGSMSSEGVEVGEQAAKTTICGVTPEQIQLVMASREKREMDFEWDVQNFLEYCFAGSDCNDRRECFGGKCKMDISCREDQAGQAPPANPEYYYHYSYYGDAAHGDNTDMTGFAFWHCDELDSSASTTFTRDHEHWQNKELWFGSFRGLLQQHGIAYVMMVGGGFCCICWAVEVVYWLLMLSKLRSGKKVSQTLGDKATGLVVAGYTKLLPPAMMIPLSGLKNLKAPLDSAVVISFPTGYLLSAEIFLVVAGVATPGLAVVMYMQHRQRWPRAQLMLSGLLFGLLIFTLYGVFKFMISEMLMDYVFLVNWSMIFSFNLKFSFALYANLVQIFCAINLVSDTIGGIVSNYRNVKLLFSSQSPKAAS